MLFLLTVLTDFLGMVVALWLATYLLARGFPSRVTLRAVVVLLLVAASLFISYLNLYQPISGIAAKWSALLTIGFMAWYDLTYQLLPPPARKRTQWIAWGIYAGSLIKIALLLVFRRASTGDISPTLWVSPLWTFESTAIPVAIADSLYMALTTAAILYNFRVGAQAGIGPHSRATWVAFFLGACSVGCGILALAAKFSIPRVIPDAFLLAAIVVLGYAIAVHQALVERRTTFHDLPVSGMAIFGLTGVYIVIAAQQNVSPVGIALITLLAVLTHSAYDIAREFLDHLLHQRESDLRRHFRHLAREVGGPGTFPPRLQSGLTNLCRMLGAVGGFIAIRQGDKFVVSASVHSLALDHCLEAGDVICDELCSPWADWADKVSWLAPAFVGDEQRAVIALGPRLRRGPYSETDLDLLAEMADWVGILTSAQAQQRQSREQLIQLAAEVRARELGLQAEAEDLLALFQNKPDPQFVRWVEEALRNLSDFTALGESPLIVELGVVSPTHIEGGKILRERLIQAIETLRPAGNRPTDLWPRAWHSYAVLHDAYIEDVPNREIMARLYISEGTFNRQRRKALHAVARALLEMKSVVTRPSAAES